MVTDKIELLYEEECHAIRGAIYEVYNELGSGFLENVYQAALEEEFKLQEIPFARQKPLKIHYKSKLLSKIYIPDFICFDKIIIELKAVERIEPSHRAQLRCYLKATGLRLGLLVNFGAFPMVDIKVSRNDYLTTTPNIAERNDI